MTDAQIHELKDMIASDRVVLFYNRSAWKHLSRTVMEYDRFECQECKKKGKYKKADLVHHVNHLKDRPDMALTFWYEENGERKRNLVSVCRDCHETVCHPERMQAADVREKFETEERWD